MSRRRKPKAEPVKLAKVIPFDRARDDLESIAAARWKIADEAITAADAHIEKKCGPVPKEAVLELHEKVETALASLLAVKVATERGLGDDYTICAQNVAFLRNIQARIDRCANARSWCEKQRRERFAPDATIYNLAEFRRFRNRVIGQVSP